MSGGEHYHFAITAYFEGSSLEEAERLAESVAEECRAALGVPRSEDEAVRYIVVLTSDSTMDSEGGITALFESPSTLAVLVPRPEKQS